jgi:hypothetical protein
MIKWFVCFLQFVSLAAHCEIVISNSYITTRLTEMPDNPLYVDPDTVGQELGQEQARINAINQYVEKMSVRENERTYIVKRLPIILGEKLIGQEFVPCKGRVCIKTTIELEMDTSHTESMRDQISDSTKALSQASMSYQDVIHAQRIQLDHFNTEYQQGYLVQDLRDMVYRHWVKQFAPNHTN